MSTAIQVRDLIVRGSRGYGIYLKGRNHFVSGCTAEKNEGPGIHAGYPSTVKDNHLGDNGDDMLLVPSGPFAYQNNQDDLTWIDIEEYHIARYETTNQEYCNFLNECDPLGQHWDSQNDQIQRSGSAGQYGYSVTAGKERYPIRFVHWFDAKSFALWKSKVTGQSYRLPTQQEWEKAAGWDPVEKKLYVYGYHQDVIDKVWCNYNNAYGGTLPVGSFNGAGGKNDARSFYGCYDKSGNIWEWTSSWASDSRVRMIRGGCWVFGYNYCVVTMINTAPITSRINWLGFRLVMDPA